MSAMDSWTTTPADAAAAPAGATLTAGRSRREALISVVIFSLCVTAVTGVAAAALWLVTGADFVLAFVLLRWTVVFILLVTPLVHQVLKRWTTVRLPYVFQTPLTALLLTFESIIVDIIGAQLH